MHMQKAMRDAFEKRTHGQKERKGVREDHGTGISRGKAEGADGLHEPWASLEARNWISTGQTDEMVRNEGSRLGGRTEK